MALGVLLGLGATALLESLGSTPGAGRAERERRLREGREAAAELRQARANGTDRMTPEQVEAEVAARRRERRSRRKP